MKHARLAWDIIGLQSPRGRLIAFAAAALALLIIDLDALTRLPTLSLYANLDIPSPSIGLTRALWLLIHGHMRAAWDMNPLAFAVSTLILAIAARDARQLARIHTRK